MSPPQNSIIDQSASKGMLVTDLFLDVGVDGCRTFACLCRLVWEIECLFPVLILLLSRQMSQIVQSPYS